MRTKGANCVGYPALMEYIKAGIALLPCYCLKTESGFVTPFAYRGEEIMRNKVQSKEGLYKHLREGKTVFKFIPADYGIVALDLDNHEYKKDGVSETGVDALNRIAEPSVYRTLHGKRFVEYIQEFFPTVLTPSGGLHLYFRYTGGLHFLNKPLAASKSIEVKHGMSGITAAGSVRGGKPYRLILPDTAEGLLTCAIEVLASVVNLPTLPNWLLAMMDTRERQEARQYKPSKHNKYKDCGAVGAQTIWRWVAASNYTNGRNNMAYSFAIRALNHGWSSGEVENYLCECEQMGNIPTREIRSCIESAARKRGGR